MSSELKHFAQISGDAPEILYHYTPPQGAIGILSKGEIRACHIEYFADKDEFHHGVRLCIKEVLRLADKEKVTEDQIQLLSKVFKEATADNTYVVCFCEQPNTLSMWGLYGGDYSGYCLGFKRDHLLTCLRGLDAQIGRCIYDDAEKVKMAVELAMDFWRELIDLRTASNSTFHNVAIAPLYYSIAQLAGFFKKSIFREEREHRIVISRIEVDAPGIEFHATNDRIKPYYRVPLTPFRDRITEKVSHLSIHVGIKGDMQLSERVISMLCEKSPFHHKIEPPLDATIR